MFEPKKTQFTRCSLLLVSEFREETRLNGTSEFLAEADLVREGSERTLFDASTNHPELESNARHFNLNQLNLGTRILES